jgi:hypothetical protein
MGTASPSYRCWLEQRLDLDEDEIARFLFESRLVFGPHIAET